MEPINPTPPSADDPQPPVSEWHRLVRLGYICTGLLFITPFVAIGIMYTETLGVSERVQAFPLCLLLITCIGLNLAAIRHTGRALQIKTPSRPSDYGAAWLNMAFHVLLLIFAGPGALMLLAMFLTQMFGGELNFK